MGVRIFKLAKELGVPSKVLMALLEKRGIVVATHLAGIEDAQADELRREVAALKQPRPAPTTKRVIVAPPKKPTFTPAPQLSAPRPAVRRPVIARSATPPPPPPRAPERPRREFPPRPGAGPGGPGGPSGPGERRGPRPFERSGGGGGGGGPPSGPGGDDKGRGKRVRVFTDTAEFARERGRRHQKGRPGGPGNTPEGVRRRGAQVKANIGLPRPRRSNDTLTMDRPAEVTIEIPITLKDLSAAMGVPLKMILTTLLLEHKVQVTGNDNVPENLLKLVGEKYAVTIHTKEQETVDSYLEELETRVEDPANLVPRPPVVTLMGHVDHGKTSLLDKIRETRVQMAESGGITQHLSAYRVDHGDRHVVFIDTPGHQAFTEMRARGANVTDVAVLVVAADDGVMPQTEEAIQHARAANVPIVVAINKIDKPNANVMRTKQQLAEVGLSPPEWGGKTEMVEVSALADLGIDDLLSVLNLETEILELRANPNKDAVGTVLDAKQEPGRGNVVTVLVREGTLRRGDTVICGVGNGRVRTLQTTTGFQVDEVGPATPVEITGLDELPEAGDRMYVLQDTNKAREISEERKRKKRALERARRPAQHPTLEGLAAFLAQAKTKQVNLIVKTDVKGSLEVLRKQLLELSTSEVNLNIVGAGVGEITERDVTLADASAAIIIGFHVAANDRARREADRRGVEIRTYQVIYKVLEEMRLSLEGLLEPELYEEEQSMVEVLQVFTSSKLGKIAGCMVRSGTVRREDPVRLVRDGKVIYQGQLESLKRFKDDAKEVKEGFECGLRIGGYNDLKVGDFVNSYKILKKARTLKDVAASTS